MKYEQPEILMDEELRLAAKKPIDKMLEMSAAAGTIENTFTVNEILFSNKRIPCFYFVLPACVKAVAMMVYRQIVVALCEVYSWFTCNRFEKHAFNPVLKKCWPVEFSLEKQQPNFILPKKDWCKRFISFQI